jgi:hypothetical protein
MIQGMASHKGRLARPAHSPAVALNIRISPDAKASAERGAAALGVSVAAYVEQVFRRLETETPEGLPAWVVEQMATQQLEATQLELRASA